MYKVIVGIVLVGLFVYCINGLVRNFMRRRKDRLFLAEQELKEEKYKSKALDAEEKLVDEKSANLKHEARLKKKTGKINEREDLS